MQRGNKKDVGQVKPDVKKESVNLTSGWPLTYNNNGFTLIELLVVVLIIGILAAVALPKYELAVAKARYMQLISLANALGKGQELYKLANGELTDDISALSIDLPPGTTSGKNVVYYSWGSCSIGTTGYASCRSARDGVSYVDLRTFRQCKVEPGTKEEFGKKICKSMGGVYTSKDGNGKYQFTLP